MKILGREPALAISLLATVVALVGTFGLHIFTPTNAAAVVVVINAVAAAASAWTTRPVAPGLFSAILSAVLALGVTYGLTLPPETVIALNATLYPLLMFLSRGQVSPVETAVTNASLDPTPEAAKVSRLELEPR